ncbi:hypothetical protein KC723_00870 [Candidatus Kaiserbacteria bacterium]|nr:hypothetical protein [Candidatus Kaiserbacteria bacterium]
MPTKKPATKKPATKKAVKKVVKKPATKKVTKKTVTKKTSQKNSVKNLVTADNGKSFWVTDGQILNDLRALEQALSSMDNKVFSYHVSKTNHDFADWVESVLCDVDCAKDLRKTKTPKSARTVVVKHLKYYAI